MTKALDTYDIIFVCNLYKFKVVSINVLNGANTKLVVKCQNGHTWKTRYRYLSKFNNMCPICLKEDKLKKYVNRVKEQIKYSNYTLLSDNIRNSHTKIKLQCDKKHKPYFVTINNFMRGKRCPICANVRLSKIQRHTFKFVKDKFKEYDYELLSKEYIGSNNKLKYKCPKGHIHEMNFSNFKSGKRCPTCAGKYINFNNVIESFTNSGYTLLEKEYKHCEAHLRYICKNGHKSSMSWSNWKKGHRCPICSRRNSKLEDEVYLFITKILPIYKIKRNDRSLIAPLEIDIVIKHLKIGIEFNGLYYHSDKMGKDKNYHLNKFKLCKDKGYTLITIFEDEWLNKKEIVKAQLKNLLNCNKGLKIINTKHCIINLVNNKQKDNFLIKNHLQSSDLSDVNIGAFYKNKLVAIMIFNKLNNSKYILNKFCCKLNYSIKGIYIELLKYFKENYTVNKLIAYADKRWSTGALLSKLGFIFKYDTKPNYWLCNNKAERIHRFNFSKLLIGNKLNTLNVLEKYFKIWDCGNLKYELVVEER